MKIVSINIKNFKGIEAFKGNVKGKNVYCIGGNATGKSSFIHAVWCGLTGKDLPPEPVTRGARNGVIEIDLGDYIARTKFKKGKPAVFELENKKATKDTEKFIKAPRTFLESRIGVLDFDIDEFFSKSNAEQIKYFAKIMSADFSDIDSEIEENEETRKFDKKKLKVLQETLEYFDLKDAEKEPISIVDLSKKIALEFEKTNTYSKIQDGINQRKVDILDLEIKIKDLKHKLMCKEYEVRDGNTWLKDSDNVPLTDEYYQDLKDSLETVETDNQKITEAKAYKQQESEIKVLEENIEENNENIVSLKIDKSKRIADLIKVDGLTYDIDGEQFLYNGLPFDKNQINTAAQLIAGMKIGASTLKDLKILKVDASLIDENNFEEVLVWAESEGIELFIELVDRSATQLKIHLDADN